MDIRRHKHFTTRRRGASAALRFFALDAAGQRQTLYLDKEWTMIALDRNADGRAAFLCSINNPTPFIASAIAESILLGAAAESFVIGGREQKSFAPVKTELVCYPVALHSAGICSYYRAIAYPEDYDPETDETTEAAAVLLGGFFVAERQGRERVPAKAVRFAVPQQKNLTFEPAVDDRLELDGEFFSVLGHQVDVKYPACFVLELSESPAKEIAP